MSSDDWALSKVISGGQSGVDHAALEVARESGLAIGGWCPAGRLCEDGIIAAHYPLQETPSAAYIERTEWNVRDSDGTLVLARGMTGGGTAATITLACQYRRPCRIVNLDQPVDAPGTIAWLRENRIRVLNIAGPRESTSAGIGAMATDYLRQILAAARAPALARRNERLARFQDVDIYPVTCQQLSLGRTDEAMLDAIIAAGARIVQLRDKEASKRELYRKAEHFRRVTALHGVLLIINDHVDIALAVDADGVHLGQDDLPVTVARSLIPDKIIGASTHSIEEACKAETDGADYINIGPIYTTGTKAGISGFLGPEAIREIGPRTKLPFTVMGGIKPHNLAPVLEAGATRIAVVTAITMQPDMAGATASLRQRILEARKS